jgi:hypothetical protein
MRSWVTVLGDVNLAEPNAMIGFAGARVSAGTIGQELPPGFQRAEFLFEHGFIDRVVHRSALREDVARLLRYLRPRQPAAEVAPTTAGLPTFRPLGFLTSLADRVLPDVDVAPAPSNGSAEADQPAGEARRG